MKAVVLKAVGPAENLILEEVPTPTPGEGEVLLRVRAAGVCYHDVVARRGDIPGMKLPLIMGHEISGDIVEVGPGVHGVATGERVVCIQRYPCRRCRHCRSGLDNLCRNGALYGEETPGGYAEYMIAKAGSFVTLPPEVSFEQGAVLSCGVGTAYRAVKRAQIKVGDSVLITGASGGVGIHCLQLAKLAGARVIAVTGSQEKAAYLANQGVEVVVSPEPTFYREAKRLTGGDGVDIVLELVGRSTLPASLRAVRSGGRVVVVGTVSQGDAAVNPGLLIMKEIDLVGSDANTLQELHEVVDLVRRSVIQPVIGQTMRLEQAAEAHRMLEERRQTGRIVLTMD